MKQIFYFLLFIFPLAIIAQNQQGQQNQQNQGVLSGNFQIAAQSYTPDSLIGAPKVNEKLLSNSFANILYNRGKFSAGLRYEAYLNTMQGYDKRYNGSGIPYRFASYQGDNFKFTVGNFYEQFGNGLILRSYEDKNLGIDNSFDGAFVRYNPAKGITIKGLVGTQRYFFDLGKGIVRAGDAEISLRESGILSGLAKTNLILGASFVSKYQTDEDPVYILPENVGAAALRMSLINPHFNINAEIARKANDPSADNGYIYKNGNAALINFNYTRKGLGILLGAKVLDNMSFRSDRNANLNNLTMNYLPAITKTHTYSLPAIYPYATQPLGEQGIQAEIVWTIKRNSKIGGRYGTTLDINASHVRNLNTTPRFDAYGYDVNWTKVGDKLYFQDINIEIRSKFNSKWKLKAAYYNLRYNKDIIEGMAGYGIIKAQAMVTDINYKIKSRHNLRWENQLLFTSKDRGNWALSLLEYNISPKWVFTFYDQYNYGNSDKKQRIHYYYASVVHSLGALRFQVAYGKQRQGIVCVGGVCRNVPASNGISLLITYSF